MSSFIISFVSSNWQDILIAFSITAIFFMLDKFVINRGRTESETFDSNDRLILYSLLSGVFIFALVWLSDDPNKGATLLGFGMVYVILFVIFLIYAHQSREQRYNSINRNRNPKLLKNNDKKKGG